MKKKLIRSIRFMPTAEAVLRAYSEERGCTLNRAVNDAVMRLALDGDYRVTAARKEHGHD